MDGKFNTFSLVLALKPDAVGALARVGNKPHADSFVPCRLRANRTTIGREAVRDGVLRDVEVVLKELERVGASNYAKVVSVGSGTCGCCRLWMIVDEHSIITLDFELEGQLSAAFMVTNKLRVRVVSAYVLLTSRLKSSGHRTQQLLNPT